MIGATTPYQHQPVYVLVHLTIM